MRHILLFFWVASFILGLYAYGTSGFLHYLTIEDKVKGSLIFLFQLVVLLSVPAYWLYRFKKDRG